ncbi:glucose-6-phosphate isomerase [Robiginitomaculum antarcticum]|uniref:glucose-6-phosphate isomerase n=1 Tax=Robiginitomaculum antarcticum TaxID=437507 RepID=UPI00037319D0|nr:glucose-6-phosphate isomerase [Robiginitomaculum antarcticum]
MSSTSLKKSEIWSDMKARGAAGGPNIANLFSDKDRLSKMSLTVGKIYADFSKHAVDDGTFKILMDLAKACDLDGWRTRFLSGERINVSENRAVLHPALRGLGGDAGVQEAVADMRVRMAEFADQIREQGRFENIVHIGIGGSDLGPRLVADGLKATVDAQLNLVFAENVDGASINDALDGLDPTKTMVVVVSKSFGTQETKMNADSARAWLKAAGCDPADHVIAVSANREGAVEFGIAPDNIFDFWDWVGGRYSVWSAVGLSLQIAYGPDAFDEFLGGAALMDAHFAQADFNKNMPVLMALIGVWNRNGLGYDSLAVIPYSRRLRKFSAFLQQLEMESNGKAIGRDGKPAGQTCPIIWGDEGTNGQHAFFQWLHQGSSIAPVDFVAVATDHEGRPNHHKALLANCIAQSEALMVGKTEAEVREELGDHPKADELAPQKTFFGNRPSTTLLLDDLSPEALGSLIALYEHKVFVQGVIWGVNSFDQWGVQLGKVLATQVLSDLNGGNGKHDPSTMALIGRLKT